MRKTVRLKYLDGIKGVAILMIVFTHIFSSVSHQNLSQLLVFGTYNFYSFFSLGWLGANTFFLLSGYLLAAKYLHQKKFNTLHTQIAFLIYRWIRLSIPYYTLLILSPLSNLSLNLKTNWTELLVHFFYLQSWLPKYTLSFKYSPTWFIGTIFWLYPFFILVARYCRKPTDRLVLLAILVWIKLNTDLVAAYFNLNTEELYNWLIKSPIINSSFFVGGIVVSDWKIFLGKLHIFKENIISNYLLTLSGLLILGIISPIFYMTISLHPNSLISTGCVGLLILISCLGSSFIRQLFSTRFLVFLGEISFSLYLVHGYFILKISQYFPKYLSDSLTVQHPLLYLALLISITLSITIAFAYFFYQTIERAFTKKALFWISSTKLAQTTTK